ncbi:hypothetical protein FA15DRAFT_666533 [Coprinopsis marcescibilis]|uniref:Uncharacterized protein n=1 Tax=Coprinopsis marcescibilis TaxID=230819 RepID=A0A5C3L395_COPMA|nr:hypothetical protein FA15DRAFT_666533 [Coprinopsis marcescibilis]
MSSASPTPSQTSNTRQNANPRLQPSPVYTFLATLVLLLSVSAAIVIRSFVLRRRHRLMVEEAIRNGTWVPSAQSRAPRVDLSKKPVLWEAYMVSNEKDLSGSGFYGGTPMHLANDDAREWDAIKPVSAAYLVPAQPSPSSVNKTESGSATDQPRGAPPTSESRFRIARAGSLLRSIGSGVREMLGFGRGSSMSIGPNGSQGDGGGNDGGASGQSNGETNPPTCGPDGGPPVIRVSVLISMPRPPKPGSPPIASSSTASSSSTSGVLGSTNSHPLSPELQQRPPDQDDEEPLPLMEMGVAELVVIDHEAEARADALSSHNAKARDSASMTGEA